MSIFEQPLFWIAIILLAIGYGVGRYFQWRATKAIRDNCVAADKLAEPWVDVESEVTMIAPDEYEVVSLEPGYRYYRGVVSEDENGKRSIKFQGSHQA